MSAFRPDIEGLRALSIALVVVYHYAGAALPGGYVGVDVFFVISGYLITLSLVDAGRTRSGWALLLDFWARRARRLLPHALLVLAACAAAGALWLDDLAASRLGSDVAWAGAYAINWLYAVRAVDYLRWGESDASVLLNFWSLAVEEQFYLVWPVVLMLLWRAGRGGPRRGVAVALGLAVASFAAALLVGQERLTLAFFASPLRAWELLAGAALALHQRGGGALPGARAGALLALLGLGLVLLSAFGLSDASRHPGWVTLLPVAGAVALLAGFAAAPGGWLARGFGAAPLRALGARSYAIYLWHWPVLMFAHAAVTPRSPWLDAACLLLSLLLAEAGYRGVESPARWRWGQRWRPPQVLALALAASGVVVAAGLALGSAAEQGVRAAATVLPPLGRVQNDLPRVYAEGCHLGVEAAAPKDGCRYGEPGVPDVLLFGDSHAAQWMPPLAAAAAARGHALLSWTKSSCPSADVTVWNPAARGPYRACDAWRDTVFDRVARRPPAFVVLANFDDDSAVFVDRRTGALLAGADAQREFEAGLARTVQRLRAAGVPLVMLRDNPRPRPGVLACLYRGGGADPCTRPRAEALPADTPETRVARATGLVMWDLGAAICGATSCPAIDRGADGRLAVRYRDDHHLAASYAATLGPAVGDAWDRAPPRR